MNGRTDWVAHAVLLTGVALFVLPVWLVFAASTQEAAMIGRGQLSFLPGTGIGTYWSVLTEGARGVAPVWHLLGVSFALLNYAFDEISNPALRPVRRRRARSAHS